MNEKNNQPDLHLEKGENKMSRKRLIKTLKEYGINCISGNELEECYTIDLISALRKRGYASRKQESCIQ